MFIIAFGLLKVMPWARYAAIIALVINLICYLKNSMHDIAIMYNHSFYLKDKILTVFLSATILAIFITAQGGIIWWLSKNSTKAWFDAKRRPK